MPPSFTTITNTLPAPFSQAYLFLRHLFTELRFEEYYCEMMPGQHIRTLEAQDHIRLIVHQDTFRIIHSMLYSFGARISAPSMECKSVTCFQSVFSDQSRLNLKLKDLASLDPQRLDAMTQAKQISMEGVIYCPSCQMNVAFSRKNWQTKSQNWFSKWLKTPKQASVSEGFGSRQFQ